MNLYALVLLLCLSCLVPTATSAGAAQNDNFDLEALEFSDAPRTRDLPHPDWFKVSFLDLREDLQEAVAAGKQGIIVYFGQRHCAYCQALLEVNFGKPDIVAYTRNNFDVVALDIWSDRTVTDMEGKEQSEKDFALAKKTNFTPSLVFYNDDGKEVLLLRGYYPPYQFRAALEFVADRHYERTSFRDYLALADPPMAFEEGGMNEEDFFESPPYALNRSRFPAQQPLAVFFEQGDCHACDILHTGPLADPAIQHLLESFDVVQLDMWADTPVVTPEGKRLTAKQWAEKLGLFYAPSILFFDARGRELLRVDSVVRFFRLQAVLTYILSRGYEQQPNFQRWRETSRRSSAAAGP